jgi:hypothetical protein
MGERDEAEGFHDPGGPNDGAPPPSDPLTEMAVGAAAAHETWSAYVEAGFTPDQALYLVGCIITAHLRGGPAQP